MILTPTARLAIACAVFLSVLLLSSFDLALTSAISAYFILGKEKNIYYKFFIASSLVFLSFFLIESFDWSLNLLKNLLIDAYLLFTGGVLLYLQTREDFLNFIRKFLFQTSNRQTKSVAPAILISLVTTVLLYPLLGGFLASLAGYILLSFLIRKFSGRIAIMVALSLILSALLATLIQKKELADSLGNYTFLFLFIGTIQEIIMLIRSRQIPPDTLPRAEGESTRLVNRGSFSLKRLEVRPLREKGKFFGRYSRLFTVFSIAAVIIVAGYFLYPQIRLLKFKLPKIPDIKLAKMFKMPKKSTPAPSPTVITPTPTAEPTPTVIPVAKITDETSILKIMVQNGTDIRGLAATTAAKLKEAGFKNIETGNSEGDYPNWEVAVKDNKENFVTLFQDILKLSDMKSSQASVPAGFDILIIAGVNP
ncbi:hypothetical protein A2781_05945 [Candidatus Gottesmanbacteria bacterium RIFCSPHIGHO2_01_FULL_42_27]|uniref:LytR/CpsA/Psr regulator C-terminal domain-containing protein n=1 Tax=Candidatus Gottesmanbacteria bacterium RIFCSPLOWO2_01_FULL_42_22 TaxID=1798391 RepID=A0A1F6B9C8_9BACT|nr:MAG: hypothetical protein A2781_05945 [Candidatus Gottesmanbacteria bacterium RIFCSPHIGHO2_01_FULL_42_27]OGG33526.1 MAG: hypothetical protein A2968_01090 [Candidatus Gottesmanbacteria bacterium RIFCSPLOWO2_01_FULL_42_22]